MLIDTNRDLFEYEPFKDVEHDWERFHDYVNKLLQSE